MIGLLCPRRLAGRTLLAALALSLASCGGSSSSDSDGDGSSGGAGDVNFLTTSQSAIEGDDPDVIEVQAIITLGEAADEDIEVQFITFGDGQQLSDWELLTPSPVTIPQLASTTPVIVQIRGDSKGELDETVTLRIIAADGADVGNQRDHRITITDDDHAFFPEAEPNDTVGQANVFGSLNKTLAYDIAGDVLPVGGSDDADIFQATALDDVTLQLLLDPASALADVTLDIWDELGQSLLLVNNAGPGVSETAQFSVQQGQILNFEVTTVGSGTNYLLEIVGLEFFFNGPDGGQDPPFVLLSRDGRDGEATIEWREAVRHGGRAVVPLDGTDERLLGTETDR